MLASKGLKPASLRGVDAVAKVVGLEELEGLAWRGRTYACSRTSPTPVGSVVASTCVGLDEQGARARATPDGATKG